MNLFCFLVEMLFHPHNSIPSHCAVLFLFPLHIFLSSLDVTHSKTWHFQILYDHRNSAFPQQEYPFSKAQSRQPLLQAESHSPCWDWGSFKATLLSRSAFHHVVIHSSCTLGLFGCLWSEKEQQSQLWNICCDKQTSGQMCAELAASERGAAVPGGALSSSRHSGFVLGATTLSSPTGMPKQSVLFIWELSSCILTWSNTLLLGLLSLEGEKWCWRNLRFQWSKVINTAFQLTSFN